MSSQLNAILEDSNLAEQLLSSAQTYGFVTFMAAAPNILDPAEWLAFLWGGEEVSPFTTHEELEAYANAIVGIWNDARAALLAGTWQWPEGCALDDAQLVTEETREFTEGMLQGWQLARDDWETIMPEDSEDNALLGGVLLSISLLFDPENALAVLSQEGADALAQFEEIFKAVPTMLCGLTQRAQTLAEDQ
ncbi:UPF0149 family protein [Photobacterium damselae subsp. damselae]|uniref:UPF0149 family protein n=1 Tax=Photobacterium damselae TaxID=38293 RepID=UPI0010FCEDD5|nr:UPF0149 family protein [Photobacterium damselae]TLS84116.1 UPF0149 family protein [Photobacterium damselae subsp. damselae]TLS91191.1 UPF0149 family protein [Photobacterium damselae subsp. damselae]